MNSFFQPPLVWIWLTVVLVWTLWLIAHRLGRLQERNGRAKCKAEMGRILERLKGDHEYYFARAVRQTSDGDKLGARESLGKVDGLAESIERIEKWIDRDCH